MNASHTAASLIEPFVKNLLRTGSTYFNQVLPWLFQCFSSNISFKEGTSYLGVVLLALRGLGANFVGSFIREGVYGLGSLVLDLVSVMQSRPRLE
jgi:hypothetical protein